MMSSLTFFEYVNNVFNCFLIARKKKRLDKVTNVQAKSEHFFYPYYTCSHSPSHNHSNFSWTILSRGKGTMRLQ